jgi:tRNA(Ile)-lysidine synthase
MPQSLSPQTVTTWIRESIQDVFPATSDTHFVVGLSGGLDSIVLTHLLHIVGYQLTAVHVNYKQRGSESDGDEEFVQKFCGQLGIPIRCFSFPNPDVKVGNFQERARLFRRQCFEEVLDQINGTAIVLAHHFDDQTETIIQKLFRGAGTSAVSGMDMYDPPYLRPLLEVTQSDIERYAKEYQLQWRDDSSNAKSAYNRNWIRNELRPMLNEQFPGWDAHLHSHVRRLSATQELAERWLDMNGIEGTSFPLSILSHISDDLGYLITHHWLTSHKVFPTAGQINQILQLLDSQPGAYVRLDDHTRVVRERSSVDLVQTESCPDGVEPRFDIQNYDQLENLKLSHTLAGGTEVSLHLLKHDLSAKADFIYEPDQLYLDAGNIEFPFSIRPWQEGDRIQPLGLSGTKLVSDVLTDQKIASARRKQAYVIARFDGKVCAVIFPHPNSRGLSGSICHDNRITEQTTSILNIQIRYPL